MRIIHFLSLLFLLIGLSVTSTAQTESQFDLITDEISSKLPALNVLLDSAIVNNSYIKFRDQQMIVNECKLRAKRVEWTRNVGFQANTGYGNLYNYTTNSSGSIDPVPSSSIRNQSQYNVSVYINMPFNTIVDRKNQIKLARTEVDQAQSMAEMQRDETRQLVIRQYNDLVLKQRLFRIKSKYLETSRISIQLVEKEFLNGVIPLTEYARLSDAASRTEADFESARMDFLTSYMILEEIVGIKFNLTNQMTGTHEGN